MIQSIYLHKEIANTLRCFGPLDEVVNRVLAAGAQGHFDVMDRPPCPGRETALRYNIDITEPTYLAILQQYGPHSPRVSIRRLLYWFVEQQVYEELGWTITRRYTDEHREMAIRKTTQAIDAMERACKYCDGAYKEMAERLVQQLNAFREELSDGI